MLNEISIVYSVKEIAENIFEIWFKSPRISTEIKPGQFVNILPSNCWKKLMRRPMSVARQKKDKFSIMFRIIGQGTEIMSKWKVGEKVDIIGPLGNYWEGYLDAFPVLMGGGIGIAPILNLHEHLGNLSINHYLLAGARTSDEHFIKDNPENQIFISTDNGSLGFHGNVLDLFKDNLISIVAKWEKIKIFACGPPNMIDGMKDYCNDSGFECDIALETLMACGFGNCQGCAVEKKVNNQINTTYRDRYALVCKDGPIFKSKDLI